MIDKANCNILVVDEHSTSNQLLKQTLEKEGMLVSLANNGHEALELLTKKSVDVILTETCTGEVSGYDILAHVSKTNNAIKVIMMSERSSCKMLKRALRENAYDFLDKPFSDHESVVVSVRRALESSHLMRENKALVEKLQISHAKVTAANKSLMHLNKQLRYLAITDGLTQLYNRRYIDDWIQNYAFSNTNPDSSYSVILLDIDYFKAINDSIGHEGGDKVLKHVARILSNSSRDEDLVGRYGGEEFIVVMPGTGESESIQAAERIRVSIESTVINASSGTARTTASLGVSTNLTSVTADSSPLSTAEAFLSGRSLISQADKALYAAKDNGRNQTIHYSQLPEQPGNDIALSQT